MKKTTALLWTCWLVLISLSVNSQILNRYRTSEMELVYLGNRYSYLMPHAAGTFHNAIAFHEKYWNYNHQKTYILLTDFEDDGHGGAIVMPQNMVFLGIAPSNFAFSIVPSSERFQWLFNHELTHVTLADKPNRRDILWRNILLGKVSRDDQHPASALMSYLTTPRWYAPRWYHEGIACYMETWMSGGLGRSLGAYDEMYFRSIILENEPLYSVIGLETEGSTVDFQVGANAYLYGARFVSYLSQKYGNESVKAFYNRTDDSKAFYGAQFRQVFKNDVRSVWQDWIQFETGFQNANLEAIRKISLTPFRPISPEPLGSFSAYAYDSRSNSVYAAINHPGMISSIIQLSVSDGKIKKIATLDSPMLYSSTYLCMDSANNRLFITENNSKYRSLVSVDIANGKKETLVKYGRIADIAYNPVSKTIWGVKHDNGYSTLVKLQEPYHEAIPMYEADFGKSMLDLSISNNGQMLLATLTGVKGEQSLVLFALDELEAGSKKYQKIYQLDDNTLTQFRFSGDDQYVIGTSYYTGVSNIFRISLKTKELELLSNVETGYFAPQQIHRDSLLVLKFRRDGMQPGVIPYQVLNDANPIQYLGNLVIEKNPELRDCSLPPASKINLKEVFLDEASYNPLKNMALSGAYPDIAGFKNTAVIGYRLHWMDRIGLSQLSLFVAGSPWSNYPSKQKIHLDLSWKYWSWKFQAALNKTDFYDLFGPTKQSRAGLILGISREQEFSMNQPFKWNYAFALNHYSGFESLPEFQNVAIGSFQSFQTLSGKIGSNKIRRSLGGIEEEQGYKWNLYAAVSLVEWNLAPYNAYPSLISEQHVGFLVPGIRNTSFWIRNSCGYNFGNDESAFAGYYFGGFRNNYVDYQPASQYRKIFAFPGVGIDQIPGSNFIKTMAELNLKPIRLKNAGLTWLYPTFIKSSLFGTHLLTNPIISHTFNSEQYGMLDYTLNVPSIYQTDHFFNLGAQIDLELVLFSYLKTTWSVGYAKAFGPVDYPGGEWMFSLKLLGN